MDIPQELRDVFCFPGAMPFIVITNEIGRTDIELVTAEEFFIRTASGLYKQRTFLSTFPATGKDGKWVNTPKNAMLVLQGMICLRGKDLSALN